MKSSYEKLLIAAFADTLRDPLKTAAQAPQTAKVESLRQRRMEHLRNAIKAKLEQSGYSVIRLRNRK